MAHLFYFIKHYKGRTRRWLFKILIKLVKDLTFTKILLVFQEPKEISYVLISI